jgi:hypothetical protein
MEGSEDEIPALASAPTRLASSAHAGAEAPPPKSAQAENAQTSGAGSARRSSRIRIRDKPSLLDGSGGVSKKSGARAVVKSMKSGAKKLGAAATTSRRTVPARGKGKGKDGRRRDSPDRYYRVRRIIDEKIEGGTTFYCIDWEDDPKTKEKFAPSWVCNPSRALSQSIPMRRHTLKR